MAELFKPAPEPATELGRYRILSSTAGVRVSPFQLGAMSIGEAWKEFMGSMDKESSFKLLDSYYEVSKRPQPHRHGRSRNAGAYDEAFLRHVQCRLFRVNC